MFTNQRQVLVVFPHPDDEAFSCAGVLRQMTKRDIPVTYACLTLGEMGRNLGNPPFATRESLPEIRREELKKAADAMGIQDLRMMGLRDKTIEFEDDEKMVKLVADLIDELNPSLVITFLPGFSVHPDHEATARAVVEAIRRMPQDERPTILAVGFANDTVDKMGAPHIKVDITDVKMDKLAALQAHASQTAWMIAETEKREETADELSDNWLTSEAFYIIQHDE